MNKHTCILFLLVLLALQSPVARSQVSIGSEEDAVRYALEHSASIRAAKHGVDVARASLRRAGAWEAPTVAFEFYSTPITSLNPLRDGLENDYSIQQMIPFPGKIGRMEDMAAAGVRMKAGEVERARRDVIYETRRVWSMLATAQRQRAINREGIQLLEQLLRSVEAAYSVARAGLADVQRVRVDIDVLRAEDSRIHAEEQRSIAMLEALLGNTPLLPASLPVEEDAPFVWELDSLGEQALFHRTELGAMNAERDMQLARRQLAQREWLPDVMLRGMYKEMHNDMPDHWALMIGVSVPIAPWASAGYAGAVEEAEADRKRVEESIEEMRRMMRWQVRDAWHEASSLRQRLERFRTAVIPSSEQALQASMAVYATAGGSATTVLDAARMLVMLRMDAEMLAGEYRVALAKLERAVGRDLLTSTSR